MIVFHGGVQVVDDPVCDYSERDDLDFGRGFYVTMSLEEAIMWALLKQAERGGTPIVNRYNLDDDYDVDDGYLFFEDADDDWFNFLEHCRGGEKDYMTNQFPIVEGEVADDRGNDVFRDYQNGTLTREDALAQLSDMDLGHQICFRSDDVIQQYLEYLSSDAVADL